MEFICRFYTARPDEISKRYRQTEGIEVAVCLWAREAELLFLK